MTDVDLTWTEQEQDRRLHPDTPDQAVHFDCTNSTTSCRRLSKIRAFAFWTHGAGMIDDDTVDAEQQLLLSLNTIVYQLFQRENRCDHGWHCMDGFKVSNTNAPLDEG